MVKRDQSKQTQLGAIMYTFKLSTRITDFRRVYLDMSDGDKQWGDKLDLGLYGFSTSEITNLVGRILGYSLVVQTMGDGLFNVSRKDGTGEYTIKLDRVEWHQPGDLQQVLLNLQRIYELCGVVSEDDKLGGEYTVSATFPEL